MSKVQIDEQEIYVFLAFKHGWEKAAGFKANIAGLDVSVAFLPTTPVSFLVSEWSSGAKIKSIPVDYVSVALSDTKNKTIALMREALEGLAPLIEHNGVENIQKKSRRQLLSYKLSFGPMPQVEKMKL